MNEWIRALTIHDGDLVAGGPSDVARKGTL
jgi:hypothetical protein